MIKPDNHHDCSDQHAHFIYAPERTAEPDTSAFESTVMLCTKWRLGRYSSCLNR
jgi:hypothetical protein